MIIHTHSKKSKKKKPNAKQRELKASWEEILARYPTKPSPVVKSTYSLNIPRETKHHPSLVTNQGNCDKVRNKEYTGSAIIGIGTLHKSNSVPVFSKEEAVEISKMRRG